MKLRIHRIIFVLLLLSVCIGSASAGNQGIDQAALQGLPQESSANLSYNIAEVLHAFSFDNGNGTWSAYNYGERTGIVTRADGSVLFTNTNGSVGMHLAGLGRGNEIIPVGMGTLVADGRRVELVRSGSSEWYVNNDEGIEQGMTITRSPEGTGNLIVLFDLTGELVPVLDGQNLAFSDRYGPVLRYGGLKAWDATRRELPAVLKLTGSRLSWEIDDHAAVYPLTIDPTITQDKILTAWDKANGDYFGYSVAVSGDTVVVGAYGADSGGTNRGQAYVFSRNQGGANNWGLLMTLIASDQANNDQFGQSVAVSGDTVVVGARDADSGGTNRGQVYVFSQNQGGTNNWGQVKILNASDKTDYDLFGRSVAVSEDTVVVGASNAASGGTYRGQAYVFSQNQGGTNNWGQVKILNASDKTDYDYFGYSVAVSGDTVVVGAINATSGGIHRGQAYVFSQNQGGTNNWGQVKILNASDKTDYDYFGYSVAVSGDTVVVGVPNADSGGTDRGQVYVFSRNQGGTNFWGQVKILTASDKTDYDLFGYSVAVSGDTVVVGAYGAASGGTQRGQAYVFSQNNGGTNNWGQVKILTASDKMNYDYFGLSVAVSGDTVVVGAYGADSGGAARGQAYVFKSPSVAPGVFRSSNGQWFVDYNRNNTWDNGIDKSYSFGKAGDIPIMGDWKGDGQLKIGVFRNGQFIVDYNGNNAWDNGIDKSYTFGKAGDIPIMGDWNGSGQLKIGVFRSGTWYVDYNGNNAWDNGIDKSYTFGKAGDIPVMGDWKGDGQLKIGVFRPSEGKWYVDYNGNNAWDNGIDQVYTFGKLGDIPIMGDWKGDGQLKIGVFRNGQFIVDYNGNNAWDNGIDRVYTFGKAGDYPVMSSWT